MRATSTAHSTSIEHVRNKQALAINVVFTTTRSTLTALKRAGELARQLGGKIRIIVPHVVPYPLPLNRPAVAPPHVEQHFRTLAGEAAPDLELWIDTRVDIRLCRDAQETVRQALSPQSIVVIGGRERLWPFTSEARLARALRREGHQVIFVNEKGGHRDF